MPEQPELEEKTTAEESAALEQNTAPEQTDNAAATATEEAPKKKKKEAPIPVEPLPENMRPENLVEAVLFVSKSPLTLDRICAILPEIDRKNMREILEGLAKRYEDEARPFVVDQIAGGYQILTRKEYAPWLIRLYAQKREEKLTPAAIETLSIIAYKQPITRADVETVRGVNSDHIFRLLLERDLIKVAGRDESLGHPLLYGTTKKFLEHFGLNTLKDLPKIEDIAKK